MLGLFLIRKSPRSHPPYPYPPLGALIFAISIGMEAISRGILFVEAGVECERQRLLGRPIYSHDLFWNHSISCPSFQWEWTVNRLCCYDTYDRWLKSPYCCYSEMYKLVVAMGLIVILLLGISFLIFFCWFYNLPHHLLYILTFKKFRLNNWLLKSKNGQYVDPSYYAKEPFWSSRSENFGYPLRPMPPRIFYPAPPANMKFRWDHRSGEIPLFVLASRQFQSNPYSARPNDRTPPALPNIHQPSGNESRRSSITESERGSALAGSRRGSGWGTGSAKNKNNSNTTNTTTPNNSANATNNTSNSKSTSSNQSRPGTTCSISQNQNQNQHQSLQGHYASSNQDHSHNYNRSSSNDSTEIPFVINMDEDEIANELREAIRLIEEKSSSDENPIIEGKQVSADSSLGETPGVSSSSNSDRIFMTNGSRDVQTAVPVICRAISTSGGTGDQARIYINTHNRSSAHSTSGERMVGVTRVRLGSKISVQLLNQQLSSSLGLSLNNLPNIQVIGNFGRADGMETIVEDDDGDGIYEEEEEEDYGTPPRSPKIQRERSPSTSTLSYSSTPRISSALDRIVTKARQEVPFRPSLPGSVPENPDDHYGDTNSGGDSEAEGLEGNRKRLNRRNSAPVNF